VDADLLISVGRGHPSDRSADGLVSGPPLHICGGSVADMFGV
jgi:hypothetical protein